LRVARLAGRILTTSIGIQRIWWNKENGGKYTSGKNDRTLQEDIHQHRAFCQREAVQFRDRTSDVRTEIDTPMRSGKFHGSCRWHAHQPGYLARVFMSL
jgi:hypothetical protein